MWHFILSMFYLNYLLFVPKQLILSSPLLPTWILLPSYLLDVIAVINLHEMLAHEWLSTVMVKHGLHIVCCHCCRGFWAKINLKGTKSTFICIVYWWHPGFILLIYWWCGSAGTCSHLTPYIDIACYSHMINPSLLAPCSLQDSLWVPCLFQALAWLFGRSQAAPMDGAFFIFDGGFWDLDIIININKICIQRWCIRFKLNIVARTLEIQTVLYHKLHWH